MQTVSLLPQPSRLLLSEPGRIRRSFGTSSNEGKVKNRNRMTLLSSPAKSALLPSACPVAVPAATRYRYLHAVANLHALGDLGASGGARTQCSADGHAGVPTPMEPTSWFRAPALFDNCALRLCSNAVLEIALSISGQCEMAPRNTWTARFGLPCSPSTLANTRSPLHQAPLPLRSDVPPAPASSGALGGGSKHISKMVHTPRV